ncbi:hypothetical protein [Magnetospirillum moscoviense]|uniref:Uncharacterized protein n=1 Tax=Magnetospirillum moscoviense TaxID=1437059 RepID=A0A178MJ67_9PROT|nr:hypothetical protein [Magnetospirillum moscoviense]OAN48716.1 hypothetical protein A6A05_14715 [Magnetospirillum moscoviense]
MENESPSPLEAAIVGYFRAPDPLHLIALFAAEPVTSRWRAQTVLTLPVFLSHLMDQAPEAADQLIDAVKGGDPVKVEVVAQAINYSHHPRRHLLMERLAGEAAAGSMDLAGADFTLLAPTHPVHVDMLWAAFFATGQTGYVERIAGLLAGWMLQPELQALLAVAGRDPSVQERALAGILADSALWSLTVNGRDVPEVRQVLEGIAARQDGLTGAMAARILAGISQAGIS